MPYLRTCASKRRERVLKELSRLIPIPTCSLPRVFRHSLSIPMRATGEKKKEKRKVISSGDGQVAVLHWAHLKSVI